MPACAMTDHGNMYGAISFYNAMKNNGVKPIIGCETYIARGSSHRKSRGRTRRESEFPSDPFGPELRGLSESGATHLEGIHRRLLLQARIDKELLAQHSKGLIALSACMSGVPSAMLAQDKCDEAAKAAIEFEEILGKGNYFLEIQEHGLDAQRRIRKSLVDLSKRTGVPLRSDK